MMADVNLKITYLNNSLVEFLKAAEADIRADLPDFSVRTLVGSSIDVFHKTQAHQRGMLANLRQPHKAVIKVGGRMFDLVVTPMRSGDRTTGFAVEWADAKERLQNIDYTAQIAALARSQAIIAFEPDGTILNPNFLSVMGYAEAEVVGRNHSLFIEPAYAASADYQAFWRRLRAGEYQASEYKRSARAAGRSGFWAPTTPSSTKEERW